MRDLESRIEIQELLSKYCFAVDEGDWVLLRELFTDDAEWITPYAHAKSGDEIASVIAKLVPPTGEGPARRHFVSNLVISLNGDSAMAKSNYLILRESGDGIIPSVVGTCLDELRKEGGRWKFRKRQLVHAMSGDMGLRKLS